MKSLIIFTAFAVGASCQPMANQSMADANGLNTGGSPRPTVMSSRIPRNQANSAIGVVELFDGTLGVTEKKNLTLKGSLTLANLFIARYGNFDGVRFEFAGSELPGYRIEYVDGPIRLCGTEETVPIGGEAWLSIRFTGAKAHTETGEPTIDDMSLPRDVAVLKDFKLICDIDGRMEWVFGISARNKYQVTELNNYQVAERNDQISITVKVKHSER